MGINVHVEPALPPDPLTATADGGETWHPDGETAETRWFGLTLDNLRAAVNRFSPGLGDLIDGFDFSGAGYLVDSNLYVIGDSPPKTGAKITAQVSGDPKISVSKRPAVFNRVPLRNGTEEPQHYDIEVSLDRTDSVSSEWGKSTEIGASATVEVSVGVEGAGGVKGSTTISYAQTDTETHSQSRELGSGVSIAVHAELAPGEQAVAGVTAWRGTVDLAVPVTARITGFITLHIRSRHWWVLTVPDGIHFDGHGPGDKVHVTSLTLPLDDHPELGAFHQEGIVNAWRFPPKGIEMDLAVHDTYHLSTGEWIDAEADVVDVPDDTETSILDAVEASLTERTGVKADPDPPDSDQEGTE
ncbi:MAG: hypothetical protein OXP08_03205 [bacterium]|nr:hypothetical protein [bacterium]